MSRDLALWFTDHEIDACEMMSQILGDVSALKALRHVGAQRLHTAILSAHETQNFDAFAEVLDEWVHPATENYNSDVLGAFLKIQRGYEELLWQSPPEADQRAMFSELNRLFSFGVLYLSEALSDARVEQVQRGFAASQSAMTVEDAEKHKADFISVASHELKTPLTLIDGYANMLSIAAPSDENPQIGAAVNGITKGIERLRNIIEDMIDMSQIEMGVLEYNRQPVWITRLLDIAIGELSKYAEERNITITLDVSNLPRQELDGDPERLYQVFEKILENAIKYTPDGGTITVSGEIQGDALHIEFADTGIGLDDDAYLLIFEKFYSLGQVGLHSTSKTKFKGGGPGLGLAIARGIVEAHGGQIWVESEGYSEEKLGGSQFYVALPMPKQEKSV